MIQWLASSIEYSTVVSSTLDNGKCLFSFFVKKNVYFHFVSKFILFIRNLYFDEAHYDGRFGHACP